MELCQEKMQNKQKQQKNLYSSYGIGTIPLSWIKISCVLGREI